MRNITEDYVSYNIAKLLKEKGFNWDCKTMKFYPEPDYDQESPNGVYAPTLQTAMKWLREVHNMHIEIEAIKPHGRDVLLRSAVPLDGVKYHASIVYTDKWDEDLNEFKWKGIPSSDSYEQACEKTIKYCIENLI